VRQRFAEAHQRVYFFGGETGRPIEFVSFRLGLAAPLRELPLLAVPQEARSAPRAIRIFEGKSWRNAQLLRRGALHGAEPTPGPALIEDPTSTLYVPSGWMARSDGNGNTILGRR
jgi:N-methylhydantoinase A